MTFQQPLKDLWHITYPFGKMYNWGRHKGLDLRTICAKYPDGIGMPVYASADGIWEKVGFNKKGGNYVKLRHENGYHSLYFHLDTYTYINGWTKVKKGSIIGHSGNTGSQTTASHLHFEIRKNGVHIDPVPMLEKFKSEEEKKDDKINKALLILDEAIEKIKSI